MATHAPLKPIQNGPKGPHSHTPTVVPKVATTLHPVSKMEQPTSEPRVCKQCRLPVPADLRWKRCDRCRSRARFFKKMRDTRRAYLAERIATEVRAQAPVVATGQENAAMAVEMNAHDDTDVEMEKEEATLTTPSHFLGASPQHPKKRKASEAFAEADPRLEVAPDGTSLVEYQTEQRLLDALRAEMERFHRARVSASASASTFPAYPTFRGSFTIIMDPAVDAERRVKSLISELAKTAKVKLGDLAKRENNESCEGYAQTHWCACDPPPAPPPPTPQPTPAPVAGAHTPTPNAVAEPGTPTPSRPGGTLERSQSKLTNWLAKPKPKPRPAVKRVPPPGCGGTITVYAVTDYSHALAGQGLVGQKITVQVEHPGRDLKQALKW